MASNELEAYVGPYSDYDENSWLAFPGYEASAHHIGIWAKSKVWLKCDEDLNVYIWLRAYGWGSLLDTDVYKFKIYTSYKKFWLTRESGSYDIEGLPSGSTMIYDGQVQDDYSGIPERVYIDEFKIGDEEYHYIGKLTDFGWNEYDQTDSTGTVWLGGIGYGYEVTDPVTIYAIPISVPGMRTWVDYFPGKIARKNSFSSGVSCNRSRGYFQVLRNNRWKDRRNRLKTKSQSSVFINDGTSGFDSISTKGTIAPLF